ncbi:MAG: porin family protein, partial [Chitinophagaceae bacterium]
AGIKAGANVTKIDGKAFSDEFKYGYSLGAFVALKVGKKLQIQPEVLLNQYNTRVGSGYDTLYDAVNLKNITLNYLSIPILLNYSPTRFFTLQAGPQFGILLNKGDNLLTNGKNAFNDGDFSMLGGVQFNIANFKIGGRYVVGLKNIGDISHQDKWKNQGFQLSIGLRIL